MFFLWIALRMILRINIGFVMQEAGANDSASYLSTRIIKQKFDICGAPQVS